MSFTDLGWLLLSVVGWGIGGMAILLAVRRVYEMIVPFDVKKEIVTDRNSAVGVSLGLFMVAMGIIIHGIVSGARVADSWWMDAVVSLGLGVLGLVLLVVGRTVLVKIARYDFNEEIHVKDNIAVGLVEGAYYVAFAIAIHAAL